MFTALAVTTSRVRRYRVRASIYKVVASPPGSLSRLHSLTAQRAATTPTQLISLLSLLLTSLSSRPLPCSNTTINYTQEHNTFMYKTTHWHNPHSNTRPVTLLSPQYPYPTPITPSYTIYSKASVYQDNPTFKLKPPLHSLGHCSITHIYNRCSTFRFSTLSPKHPHIQCTKTHINIIILLPTHTNRNVYTNKSI